MGRGETAIINGFARHHHTEERPSSTDRGWQAARRRLSAVKFSVVANLPTRFGFFRVMAVQEKKSGKEHLVLTCGEVSGREKVPVRVHSECLTGDVMGSLRCDCRDQLERSLRLLEESQLGALIYLRQEGRGIGLINKIRAYSLQERGYDTVEANHRLGFQNDLREYNIAIRIIRALGMKSISLITNNPGKIEALRRGGILVERRIPLVITPNRFNKTYLRTKKRKLGHLLADEAQPSRIVLAPAVRRRVRGR